MLSLQAAPQDLPYSSRLMNRMIVLYGFTGIVVLSAIVEPQMALARMVLSLAVLLLFTYLVLSMLGLKPRFVQTVTALCGTGVVFNLLTWPILGQMARVETPEATPGILPLMMLILVSWEVMVTAHIYRHALNMLMAKAILMSIGLFLISMTLTQLIFPSA